LIDTEVVKKAGWVGEGHPDVSPNSRPPHHLVPSGQKGKGHPDVSPNSRPLHHLVPSGLEAKVFPAVQCKLADVLAHSVLGKRKHKERSLILETHSEHLMLRLLRRIRERHEGELQFNDPEIEPEDISVLYIEKDQGEVKITHLPVTEDGDFEKKWPKGFFEERTEELF